MGGGGLVGGGGGLVGGGGVFILRGIIWISEKLYLEGLIRT